jgi:LysR family glycine cleavage system transcriptional activator
MARHLPPLLALRAFEAAARHLSFTEAAKELNVTQGAISRHIKSLEGHLRVTLFRRLSRSLELTPEGATYYPALREALDTIERATRRIFSRKLEQVLTLSVLPTLAMSWIIPRLPAFSALHPEIELRMVTSIHPADFRTEIDVAIRVGKRGPRTRDGARIDLVMAEEWSGIASEFLMPDVLVPVCSPALPKRGAPLRKPADLKNYTLLHNATRPHAWADWLEAVGEGGVHASAGPTYGHFFLALQAAAEGKGVACVPSVLVEQDIAAKRLMMPFEQRVESEGAYYLLYRQHEADSEKVRAFRTWLLGEVKRYTPA